jgi:hypothetical protein
MVDKDQVYDVRPAGPPGKGKPAGKRDVQAWMRQHRLQLLGGGAGAVVLLALVAKRRAGSAAASGSATPTRVVPPGASYGDPQDFRGAAGAGVYDSTASDVYNSLQPQIEQVQRSIESLIGLRPGSIVEPVVTLPEAAPRPAPAPTSPTSSYQPPPPAPAPVAFTPTPAPVAFTPAPAPVRLPPIIDRFRPPPPAPPPPVPRYVPPPLAPAPTYRLDNPYRPPSHTNPILRPGDAPSPGNAPRPGGTLAQIAADSAKYAPIPMSPTPSRSSSPFKRIGLRR